MILEKRENNKQKTATNTIRNQRLTALDAARGLAVIGMLIQHFALNEFNASIVSGNTMILFILCSGISFSLMSKGMMDKGVDVKEFISKGKPYIAFGNMGMSNIKDMIPEFKYEGPEWERYEGLFLTNVKQDNAITAPYDSEEYFYTITGSYITSVPKNADILITMSNKENFFKAGWWPGHDDAKGNIMAFKYNEGSKNLTVFANDLTNDGHPQYQFRLLANSIFAA